MKKVSDLSRLSPFEKHPTWSVPMHMLLTVIISFSTLPVMDMEVQDNLSTGVYLGNYKGDTPFLLSGGIRPESLPALSGFHHPRWAGIDLNSGFETAPAPKRRKATSFLLSNNSDY